MSKWEGLIGTKVNRLTINSFSHRNERGEIYLNCTCECGVEKTIKASNIYSNRTKSCGCLQLDIVKVTAKKHGLSNTKLFMVYAAMLDRCRNKNHKRYVDWGGRGITVCDEWKNDFMTFYNWAMENGYKEGLSLDRVDNDSNYEPSNCRWSTRKEQQRNTRQNYNVTFNGETKCITEWSEIYGISPRKIKYRDKHNLDLSIKRINPRTQKPIID